MKHLVRAIVSAAALSALAACAANGSSSLSSSPSATGTTGARGSATAEPLPAQPGSVTIGSADFPESELLAYVYAGAMKAHGVTTTVHPDIGERPVYIAALKDGSIGAVPEYSGAMLDYLNPSDPARSPQDIYLHLQQRAAAQGLSVTRYAPGQDADTITVTRATATKYHLSSIGDLKGVASRLKLGAPAPLQTVSYGVPALKKVYGVAFGQFVALAPSGSITQTALRNGTVDAADLFSTDPAISRNGFVPLADPQNIFAAQNVVPLFRQGVLTQPMADACNAVSLKLTTAVLQRLDTEVADGTNPSAAAAQWLTDNGFTS